MPVDGSYGRLSEHNQRFKELRRRKLKRREEKLFQNSIKTHFKHGDKINFDTIDPEQLRILKAKIRKKAKTQHRNEILLIILSLVIGFGLVYFLYTNMTY